MIKKLKNKLFEKVKEHNLVLFQAVPYKVDSCEKYSFEGNNIEEFIDFAHKMGVQVIYYDLDHSEDENLVGIAVHFKFDGGLYRFHWWEDEYHAKLKKEDKEKTKEIDKIVHLREQYEKLFNERFEEINTSIKCMDEHFMTFLNVFSNEMEIDKNRPA